MYLLLLKRFLMEELTHLPLILLVLLTTSSFFPDHFSTTSAINASLFLTIVVNWTGWSIAVACALITMFLLILIF